MQTPLSVLHPAVAAWFTRTFERPTPVQAEAWPAIKQRRHTLIAAPTGTGKTLAAFLAAIDDLVHEEAGRWLDDTVHVLYVSPLKALSNDIHRNLEQPLNGIRDELLMAGIADVPLRAMVRTGDTPVGEREKMRRRPPHILVTTPESLYILLTSASGRTMLRTTRTVIVDEIHALAGNKRGAHLALSLERLEALCERPPTRVGLSATQRPIDTVARFLVGARHDSPLIIDAGHGQARDLALELPRSPLEAVMATEVWGEIYDRLAELAQQHRTTLVFVNTRRHAERVAKHLAERLGEAQVAAHHGSLARRHRLDAEQRLKAGTLRVMVATASLELGIDIGEVELVCQLGSPHTIAAFLQRVGRSGHWIGGIPKGRLFPLSRDDLVECAALLDAVRRDELDRLTVPDHPLDVLGQQIVAEVASQEWDEDALYHRVLRAWPYRDLSRAQFEAVVEMLADGFHTRRGRRGAYLHRDAVNRRLRARRGARLTAVTNGGAIPDMFDYDVVLEPEGLVVGTLNEDFAFESLPGDIFQLGNTSYRVLRVETGKVRVADAHGQPPTIPFWFGEAPGRTDELSEAVSRLRATLGAFYAATPARDTGTTSEVALDYDTLYEAEPTPALGWLTHTLGLPEAAARQLDGYLHAAHAALGTLPTQDTVVLERFFDEAGDMHLVIHAPFGSRLNRAWGLALRKRFCRTFNFELQAAALEDCIVLSLGTVHSFDLAQVPCYLHSRSVRDVLIQAMLDAPMFASRWRWAASIALAIQRFRGGKKVAPQLQRMDAEDLSAIVFPDHLACFENIQGARQIPDHPLVNQAIADCLYEGMDIAGLERLLGRIEAGEVAVVARDLTEPSPLAHELLGARPHAFLDDAPAEERRTRMVKVQRHLDPQTAAEIGRLDPAAIARVRHEAWPEVANPDELHDALITLGFMTEAEGRGDHGNADWRPHLDHLARDRRACRLVSEGSAPLWVAAERLPQLRAVQPRAAMAPPIAPAGPHALHPWTPEDALRELVRGRLEGLGPVTAAALAWPLGVGPEPIEQALLALEAEGFVLRGRFTDPQGPLEWCERRLLARIHRYTVKRLRAEVEPVSVARFMGFLFRWQGLTDPGEGVEALHRVLTQLEGCEVPAAAWEANVLPARLRGYDPAWLDQLCQSGRIVWLRLPPSRSLSAPRRPAPVRSTPLVLLERKIVAHWHPVQAGEGPPLDDLASGSARQVREALHGQGALFFDDLVEATGLLPAQVEAALAELVALGQVSADGFAGLRALIAPAPRAHGSGFRARRRRAASVRDAGRWTEVRLIRGAAHRESTAAATAHGRSIDDAAVGHIARVLLSRYGVVFRSLLERESSRLPPWRELVYVYRRMEARGELRGGRFVASVSGEQYALPEAVAALRTLRQTAPTGELVAISAADPLNLVGVIMPGQRVPALTSNRILYRDGVPIALRVGGEDRFLETVPPAARWRLHAALLGRDARPPLRHVE